MGFSSGAICRAFASLAYDECDYIRDYQEFLATVRTPANGGDTG